MNRAAAHAAIDEAAAEALRHAFGVMVTNLIAEGAVNASQKFERAAGYIVQAHFAAGAVLDGVLKS